MAGRPPSVDVHPPAALRSLLGAEVPDRMSFELNELSAKSLKLLSSIELAVGALLPVDGHGGRSHLDNLVICDLLLTY